ncbi:flagellar motor protein MotB [Rhizobium sp. Root483D2]|jgi:chemotaxis protein MotB|uniref:flagellar motor protein MotB n=1 Tax=Rhizobium sp. Root483D2 TaxID=1736545 RepID=UPI0007148EBE|nr:flagellar motor protein MotB [Rhizobium sp. Root483D2]KQY48879.1 flagellar motor protein MotB [Rhizobium sp. Root483D2]
MSENEGHHHGKNEIIIIKRHSGGHDGHHGGAWKIAYADFMTAMMAFFLVMWLINAANPQTKAALASYFNPVQLTDAKPSEKGVKQPAKDAKGEEDQMKSKVDGTETKTGGSAKNGDDMTATSGEETQYSDADFFENPYSVMSEIVNETGRNANISAKGEGGASTSGPATGADGGEAYRDPFDPDFWTKQVELQNAEKGGDSLEAKAGNGSTDETKTKPEAGKDQADAAIAQPADAATTTKAGEDAAKSLKADIEKEIGGSAGKLAEGLLVTPTEGGLLVTISEQANTPMFGLGSAVPERDMVIAMEKIGKLLSARSGAIAIRGHTDARPFKRGAYDNWRLSSDRAQSAYYMLVRGGLAENRVSQISGFADKRLQDTKDPMAPVNRRIEILLQTNQG